MIYEPTNIYKHPVLVKNVNNFVTGATTRKRENIQEVRTIRRESRRNQYGYRDSFHTNLAKHQPRRAPNDKEYPIDPILPGEVYLSHAQRRSLLLWVYPPKDYQPLSSWLISREKIYTNGPNTVL